VLVMLVFVALAGELVALYGVLHPAPPTVIVTERGFNAMTGADWLVASASRQDEYAKLMLSSAVRCPSSITPNDLALGITGVAQTKTGYAMSLNQISAAIFVTEGCQVKSV